MKGTICMKVTPRKEGPRIRTAVRLRHVGMMDRLFLVKSFLKGLEIPVDEAKVLLELIASGVAVSDTEAKEDHHD